MPLTSKGETILAEMKKKYGEEEGKRVFYASKNAGTISGVDQLLSPEPATMPPGWPAPEPFGGLPCQVSPEEVVAASLKSQGY